MSYHPCTMNCGSTNCPAPRNRNIEARIHAAAEEARALMYPNGSVIDARHRFGGCEADVSIPPQYVNDDPWPVDIKQPDDYPTARRYPRTLTGVDAAFPKTADYARVIDDLPEMPPPWMRAIDWLDARSFTWWIGTGVAGCALTTAAFWAGWLK